jgi:hypothetical protein
MHLGRTIAEALLCAALLPTPAFAQSEVPTTEEATQDADIADLHLPGFGRTTGRTWLEFEVAPELVSHNPLGSSSRASDATNVSLTVITTHPLSRSLEIEIDGGPSTTIDTDEDRPFESSLAAGVELRTRPGPSGFASFVSYSVARDFEDFFGEGLDTVQTLKAGVRYGGEIGPMAVGVELAPRWVNSSFDLDDYLAGELWMEGVIPVFGEGIDFIAEGIVDRRWYQNFDPVLQGKRRDWRIEAFFGLDFAGAVAPKDSNWLRSLGVGVGWLDVHSNEEAIDSSSLKFLPAVTVRLGL